MRSSKSASFETTALNRTAEECPCKNGVLKAQSPATRLPRPEKGDIPRVAPVPISCTDSLQLISHGCKVKGADRDESGRIEAARQGHTGRAVWSDVERPGCFLCQAHFPDLPLL